MYTATMMYDFKDDSFETACEIWKTQVMEHAKSQPGFVRMQFLTARPQALAIGTWAEDADARRFMETGIFKRLMTQLKDHVKGQPRQTIWDLRYFAEKKQN